MIIQKAFKRVEEYLNIFPESILNQLKIPYYKKQVYKEDPDIKYKLFFTYCLIFQFIAKEENRKIDPEILIDFTELNILEYLNGVFYDNVFDDKDTIKLPIANLLFRKYILLAGRLNVDIDPARDTFEKFFYEPLILKIGKIELQKAIRFNQNWSDVIQGFATSVNIVNHYVDSYINNKKWKVFFRHFLLYRQLLDDVNDFVEDYRNGELKCYGILALVQKFKKRETINLKNPLTAFWYQLFVLRNYNSIYEQLIKKFENLVAQDFDVKEFYQILERLELFQEKYSEMQ